MKKQIIIKFNNYECLNSLTDTYIYMEVLAVLNVVYKSLKRRNPNELLSFILDNLHSELNKKQEIII